MIGGGWAGEAPGSEHSVQKQDLTALSLEELGALRVTTVSLHEESVTDAPASVTVITAEEIGRSGYRTLAEALSWVRGFFTTSDYTYDAVGIRGFALPGFEARYMIMINGHKMSDNILDSTPAGTDLPLDLDLVDRIEVVRGPSSALYGSSAMLATINVITKKPFDIQGTAVRIETGSLGERKLGASAATALGKRATLLVGASVFNNTGPHQLYFSELDTVETNFGRAIDLNGEKGYRVFADLVRGNWEVLALAGDRVKTQPISWGDTVFNDRGTRAEDSRGFFELSYTRQFPGDRSLSWRTSYDAYRFRGIYHYALSNTVEDSRERDYGDWLTSTFTYRFADSKNGHLTLGTELEFDLRALQNAFDVAPVPIQFLRVDPRDRHAGVLLQQEWAFGRRWEVSLGTRFDWSWLKRNAISPRIAVTYKPANGTDLKLMYGRGFRNPSSYDVYWEDGFTQIGNSSLRPETSDTFDFGIDHTFGKRVRASASAYHYLVNSFIEQVFTGNGMTQYVNADRLRAAGVSLGLDCVLPGSVRLSSSLEMQRAAFDSAPALPNSPGQVGKLRLVLPVWRERLMITSGLQTLGQRQTYAGVALPWVILPEVVVSAAHLAGGFEFSAGVRNLSNSFYREPAGLTPTVDSVIGMGRSYFLNLIWHSSADRVARSD